MEHKRQRVQFRWVCLKPRMKGPDLHDSWRGQTRMISRRCSRSILPTILGIGFLRPSDLDALLRTSVSSSLKANRVAPQLSSNPKRRA